MVDGKEWMVFKTLEAKANEDPHPLPLIVPAP
jgi:hypothetical protein